MLSLITLHRVTSKMTSSLPAFCLICMLGFGSFLQGAPITVTDQKGRAIEIELVSVANDSVTFNRAGKEYTLPISNFAEASQQLIRKESDRIPAVIPKIQPDVVIGKRRQKDGSSYMVKQEITSTVKLSNSSNAIPIPSVSGKMIYIGQDRRTPELFEILSSQPVEASFKPGETVVREMEPFMTRYDSDNKGTGNIGGSQYVGYVLVLLSDAGDVVLDQTTTPGFRQAIAEKPSISKELVKHPKGLLLTKNLNPAPVARNTRRVQP